MATHIYTELELRKLKGQALKDVWHTMIGKGPGIKNTTGLKNSEEILQAILLAQVNQEYLNQFTRNHCKEHKQIEPPNQQEVASVSMPPKKAKAKSNAIVPVQQAIPVKTMAVEAMEPIEKNVEVHRICLKKVHLGGESYFVDKAIQTVYSIVNNRPGTILGKWNPDTKSICAYDV
jgi:hypothetical protein